MVFMTARRVAMIWLMRSALFAAQRGLRGTRRLTLAYIAIAFRAMQDSERLVGMCGFGGKRAAKLSPRLRNSIADAGAFLRNKGRRRAVLTLDELALATTDLCDEDINAKKVRDHGLSNDGERFTMTARIKRSILFGRPARPAFAST
jgi:hypothetical protein